MLRQHEAVGRLLRMAILGAWASLAVASVARSQPVAVPSTEPPASGANGDDAAKPKFPPLPEPVDAKQLSPQDRVWVDLKNHQVLVDGYVALRSGYLEMFACPVGTKEHESVVAVHSKAATIHAALLAVGAVEGHPVRYRPEFAPPEGTEIEIEVRWRDAAGEWQSARAQDWIREVESKKTMTHLWVFAGSGFWTDEETGKRYYMAEQGDLICVSNFTTATLDVPIESSQSNEGLLFEANPDTIPEAGMPVRVVLKPKLEARDAAGDASAGDEAESDDDTDRGAQP